MKYTFQQAYPRWCSGIGCNKQHSCKNFSKGFPPDSIEWTLWNIHLNDCMYYFKNDIIEPGIHRYKPPQETFNGYNHI